jgi:UDP-glucuronate 4-epimerase
MQKPKFRLTVGRLEERETLERIEVPDQLQALIHLAARAGVQASITDPHPYIEANIVGTWRVMELAARARPIHTLIASTSSVYAGSRSKPNLENDRADAPLTMYGATKRAAELVAHSYSYLHSLPTTILRFFTVYGPWGRPDMAVYKFTDLLDKGEPLTVYGDGSSTRDYTFIDDLIEAIIRLKDVVPKAEDRRDSLDSLSGAAPYRIVNIGPSQPVSLSTLIESLAAATGKPAICRHETNRRGDPEETHASNELLSRLIRYKPTTPIDEGSRAFVDWYREWTGLSSQTSRAQAFERGD